MSTHRTEPKEPPRTAVPAAEQGQAPVPPGKPLPPGAAALVSAASPRRSAGIRLRQAAASSSARGCLGDRSGRGIGAGPRTAGSGVSGSLPETDAAVTVASGPGRCRPGSGAERLAGVRQGPRQRRCLGQRDGGAGRAFLRPDQRPDCPRTVARRPDSILGRMFCKVVLPAVTADKVFARRPSADYPSGQRGLTVNQLAMPTGVRIPHLPPKREHPRS